MNYEELKKAYDVQKQELADAHSEIDDLHNTVAGLEENIAEERRLNIGDSQLEEILKSLGELVQQSKELITGPELSASERRLLQGAGVRRYGLIDEISDVMEVNPQFIPGTMSLEDFKRDIRYFEEIRNCTITAQQVLRILLDVQLILGDDIYRQALSYYGAVRDAARRRVPGAPELFARLRVFFTNFRRRHHEDPTEAQLLHDFRALEHGRKDGEIVIRNESDKTVRGSKVVVDDVHKAKGAFKETEHGEVV